MFQTYVATCTLPLHCVNNTRVGTGPGNKTRLTGPLYGTGQSSNGACSFSQRINVVSVPDPTPEKCMAHSLSFLVLQVQRVM